MTTTKTFPRTTPSALDIDARGVLAFVDALESTPGVEPHSLMLLRHGQVVAEGWWQPYAADRVHLLYSLSKSFTAAAVGIAVREGLIDLDATALSYFPELDDEITDERSRRIREAEEAGFLVVRSRTVEFPDGRRMRTYMPYEEPDDFED